MSSDTWKKLRNISVTVPRLRSRRSILLVTSFLILAFASASFAASPGSTDPAIHYTLSLAQPAQHLVHVTVEIPAGPAERDLQLPVWNALYQVRDFAQYVNWVRAKDLAGQALSVQKIALQKIDKSRWRIRGANAGAVVEYEIFLNQPGPYDAELNSQHGFFNLAETLMYPVDARTAAMQVQFVDVPAGWKFATALAECSSQEGASRALSDKATTPASGQVATPAPTCFMAENYDRLVDSPIEAGTFQESDFDEGGGHYRVVVDAAAGDYDMQNVVATARKLVWAETSWMNDRPFESYLFIYHFPREALYGGMEHAYSTAITLNSQVLMDDPQQLADVTAHEFFHLWNVKRIRPQSLEPVDYTKENYTDALWFSEGVTSTVEDYILLRAGLLAEKSYFNRLADAITTFERRSAHLTQSAEESSLDAWLEKYPYYRLPQRSISYYNKGQLLGVLLDLAMRDASHNTASLRDLFQWMNQNYARQGKFFADSDGIREAAETLTHTHFDGFFQKYVAGTAEIPWNDFFSTVGLQVIREEHPLADLGFAAARSFEQPVTVTSINPASTAERSGLAIGDVILEIDGHVVEPSLDRQLANLRAGDTLRLHIRSRHGERELNWKLASRTEVEFELKDVDNITPQQKARRNAWLKGESQPEVHP